MTLNDWYSFFQLGSAIALFLTFAFGVGAILAGLQVNKASGRQVRALETRLAEANSETERIKANAAKLKRESDEKIAQLNNQTARLSSDAEKARESIAVANERTAKLESDAAAARLSTEELRKANTEALIALEKEKRERLDMESALSPRMFRDQGGAGQRLSKFAPINVVIEYLPEIECRRTAGQIAQPLHDFAKWNILAVRPNANELVFFDGVIVQVDTAGAVSDDVRRVRGASEALIAELNKSGIEARSHAADRSFPQGTIVIRVGMKPNPALQRLMREEMERMGFPQEMIDQAAPIRK